MSSIYCPGGQASQTGCAVTKRYPGVNPVNCGGIPDIPQYMESHHGLYVTPIWNSNQGEIKASEYVWDLIEASKIRISDIWPKSIQFWLITRTGEPTSYGVIGSVIVAETQCSNFLEEKAVRFQKYPLTTDAFDAYKGGAQLDGVLLAPGQGEHEDGYFVADRETANANNFTSFVQLSSLDFVQEGDDLAYAALTGVTMNSLAGTVLDENQMLFFENMFSDAINLDDIPKPIFVFKRTAKIGMLFEGEAFYSGDYLDAEVLETGDILVHEDAGSLKQAYREGLVELFSNEFNCLLDNDFILHRGVNTVLFACPPLGIFIHGFEEKTVEPVMRIYLDKIFEFIDNDGDCKSDEKELFKRYANEWKTKRSHFVDFTIV
ncbi:MAG: hypothetical protein L3J28_12070 [Candidatus Polarisedimenticolaceae bacterium]|nr:hypothetical protein [Candidatus Polarisedimenticolaceae bacterium]